MNGRAKRRLELARDIMDMPGVAPLVVLSAINAKTPQERDALRDAVDWLEDYEAHEKEFPA